jgi:tRNA pseudouridine38-40 synthase
LHNYKLVIEYDGTDYFGWQRQKNTSKTIQEVLESSLKKILKTDVTLTGSGRTDTGVHALNQAANFKIDTKINNLDKILYSLNSVLPADISVKSLKEVKKSFHSRHSAKKREYEYKLTTRKRGIDNRYYHRLIYDIDVEKINKVLPELLGYKSFRSLCRNASDKYDFKCKIFKTSFKEYKSREEIIFNITGSRFLHSMVRAIAGVLIDIGRNKISINEFKRKFKKGEKISTTYLPPNGLFLKKIYY